MTKKIVLADTGPLVAILNRRDHKHAACVEALQDLQFPLLTCLPVLTEVSHLVRPYGNAFQKLLTTSPNPLVKILSLDRADVTAALGIVEKYRDQDFDFADACLMHLAERERISQVFTLDHKDFSVFRPSHSTSLEIIG